MKSIAKIGSLLAALVCVTTFGASQPAEAHDYDRDRHDAQVWQQAERHEANVIRNEQERAAAAYSYSPISYNPYAAPAVCTTVAPYANPYMVYEYGQNPYMTNNFQVNHPVISNLLQGFGI